MVYRRLANSSVSTAEGLVASAHWAIAKSSGIPNTQLARPFALLSPGLLIVSLPALMQGRFALLVYLGLPGIFHDGLSISDRQR
jgi:hypothetical protein